MVRKCSDHCLFLATILVLGICSPASLFPESPHPPAGHYTGAGQRMIIADNGDVRFRDSLGITHIEVTADGNLRTYFSDRLPEGPQLLTAEKGKKGKSWSTIIDGKTYRAKAIPFSPELYAFRLEVHQNGKLIAGEQQFFAISPKPVENGTKTPDQSDE